MRNRDAMRSAPVDKLRTSPVTPPTPPTSHHSPYIILKVPHTLICDVICVTVLYSIRLIVLRFIILQRAAVLCAAL